MKRIFLLLSLIFFLLSEFVNASSILFLGDSCHVISYSGNVQIKIKGKDWENVTVGRQLKEDDLIRIPDKCYITLFDIQKEQYIIIHGNRTLKLSDLKSKPTIAKSISMFDLVSKIFNDFTNFFSSSISDTSVRLKLRDSPVGILKPIAISPKKSKVLSDNIIFRWSKDGVNNKYRFILLNENFKVIIDTVVKTNALEFKKLSRKLLNGQEYVWQIISEKAGKEYKELNIFKLVNDLEARNMISRLDSLDHFINLEKDANYLILKGLLFEENEFYSEALENYLAAIKMNPAEPKYIYLVERIFNKLKINLTYTQAFNN
jgi:hypothetical protein